MREQRETNHCRTQKEYDYSQEAEHEIKAEESAAGIH